VLDLIAAGRRVVQIAADLDISDQKIYIWRRQELVDTGQLPGISSAGNAELIAARRRIAELEAEGAIHRRAAELLSTFITPVPDAAATRPADLAERNFNPSAPNRDGPGRGWRGARRLRVRAQVARADGSTPPGCSSR
jgi:transposase